MTDTHWADKHITPLEDGGFIAYDESGLEFGNFGSRDAARTALDQYATWLENSYQLPSNDEHQ